MDSWLCSFLNIKCTEWRPYSCHFQLLLHFQQLFSVMFRQLCRTLLHFFIHKTVNIQYNYPSLPSICQTIQFWCIRDITNMTKKSHHSRDTSLLANSCWQYQSQPYQTDGQNKAAHVHRVGPSTNSAKFFSGQNIITAVYPLNRRLGGTHSQSELFWGQKNLLPLSRINRFLSCPSHSLFTIPHILSQLPVAIHDVLESGSVPAIRWN